jgi:hypothetical protein
MEISSDVSVVPLIVENCRNKLSFSYAYYLTLVRTFPFDFKIYFPKFVSENWIEADLAGQKLSMSISSLRKIGNVWILHQIEDI